MSLENKIDALIEKSSAFHGEVRADLATLKERTTRMETSLEAHKDDHAAELKEEVKEQKTGNAHRWEAVITAVIAIASLAVACAALFVNQPKP